MARPKKIHLFALVWFIATRETFIINLDQIVDKTKRREGVTTKVFWSEKGKRRKWDAKIVKISDSKEFLSSIILDDNGNLSKGDTFTQEVIEEQEAAKADLKRANEETQNELSIKKRKLNERSSIFERSGKASTNDKVTSYKVTENFNQMS